MTDPPFPNGYQITDMTPRWFQLTGPAAGAQAVKTGNDI
jgi:hypothetical protein